jgi:hypothetical protein
MVAIGVGQNHLHANGAISAIAPATAPTIPTVRSAGSLIADLAMTDRQPAGEKVPFG